MSFEYCTKTNISDKRLNEMVNRGWEITHTQFVPVPAENLYSDAPLTEIHLCVMFKREVEEEAVSPLEWVDDTVDLTVDVPTPPQETREESGKTVLDAIVPELADHPTEEIPVVELPAVKTVSGVIVDKKQLRMDELAETVDAYRAKTQAKVDAVIEHGLARMEETDRESRKRVLPQVLVEVSS